jgi:NAD dependent epimerase/dehydratase family enzyme
MPWIHVDDVVGLLLHALGERTVAGAMNAVAPTPVTNAEFTRTLAAVLRRPAFLAAPALVLRATLGEMADVVLGSQRVAATVAVRSEYRFRFPALEAALRDALGARAAPAHDAPRA